MTGLDAVRAGPPLRLLREARLATLLAQVAPDLHRLEASGIVREDGLLWIICDNLPHILAVDPSLEPKPGTARVVRRPEPAPGYEDIAWDQGTGRRFVLIESTPTRLDTYRPQIDEFDDEWRHVARRWVELPIRHANKGLEGLTCVHRDGVRYLLALSESNDNLGGQRGQRPGGGLVHVLAERGDRWVVLEQIRLPSDLPFVDYSGLSVRGERIAVVSQESSALWVGRLDPLRWRVADAGRVHPFPRDRRGRIVYGTAEGVCWFDDDVVAVASDRAKPTQPRRQRAQGESVHLFAIPSAEPA